MHIIFVVVGRLPKSLVKSKVEPIAKSKLVKKVYIFSQKKGFDIKGVSYITLPQIFNSNFFLIKLMRIFYEPFQLLIYSFIYSPSIIKGIYVMPKGLNSLIVAKIYRCKLLISNIGGLPEILTYHKRFREIRRQINLFIYRKADYVTTKGYSIIDYLTKEGVSKTNIDVFNGSIDTNRFNFSKTRDKEIDILFVGSFIYRKGPNRVVEMIEKLKHDYNNDKIRSVFLGKGELTDSINHLIEDKNLKSNISIIGHVDNTENYFQKSKVLVMPSTSEGLSTAMLEAMSSGCVPVVSNVGEMTKAALDGFNSFVINDYNDIRNFSEKINILLSDETLRNKMALNGRKHVLKEYAIDVQMNQFDLIIKNLMK